MIKLLLLFFFCTLCFGVDVGYLKEFNFPNKRVIKITGHPDYPPVIWNKDGTDILMGIAPELIKKIFSEIDVEVKLINTDTWGRAQVQVEKGKIDLLMPPYKNPQRVKIYNYYGDSFLQDDTVIFIRKDSNIVFEKLEDLKGKTGVAIIHDSFGAKFDEYAKSNLKVTKLPKTEQCFNFLLMGRADYMIAGLSAGLAVSKKMKITDKVRTLDKKIVETGMYLPFSFKSKWNIPQLHEYINMRIDELKKDGYINKLKQKYIKVYNSEK